MIRGATLLLCVFVLNYSAPFAPGDDFSPPPWDRADPRAVTAEWEFLTNANPIAPDGPLTNVLTKGSGTAPGGTFAQIFGANSQWLSDAGGAWGLVAFGDSSIHFQLDNIVDTEPVKYLQVQVTWFPAGDGPMGITVDPLAAVNTGATGSTPTVPDVTTTIDEGGAHYTLITWEMHPNPPWEQFDLLLTGVQPIMAVTQVVVDTISVPEPSSILLASLGLVAVAYAGRRRGWAQHSRVSLAARERLRLFVFPSKVER